MTTGDTDWRRFRGDGTTLSGEPATTPGERGRYLADPQLAVAVNTALAVDQPLLVSGEPGVGKTRLAWSVAAELELGEVLEFHTRSDHRARDVLFTVDHLKRFYHAQVHDAMALDIRNYIRWQALGVAIQSQTERVVLIDEIDKAPRDFPNDLLDEIDRKRFAVADTGETYVATAPPVVIITSNSERDLPDAFLRRCVFHYIEFPDADRLKQILRERLGDHDLGARLVDVAVDRFQELRAGDLSKKPSTAELLAWVRVLHKAGVDPHRLERVPLDALPFPGVLRKSRSDLRQFPRPEGP